MTKEEIYQAIAKLDRKMETAAKSLGQMAEQLKLLKAVAETIPADPTENETNDDLRRALDPSMPASNKSNHPERGKGLMEKLQQLRVAMNDASGARGTKLKKLRDERYGSMCMEAAFEKGSFEPYAEKFISQGYDLRDILNLREKIISSGDFWEYKNRPKGEL